jgi:hypothetical protein
MEEETSPGADDPLATEWENLEEDEDETSPDEDPFGFGNSKP